MKKKNIIITIISVVVALAIALGQIFAPEETADVLQIVSRHDAIGKCSAVVADCVSSFAAPDGSTPIDTGLSCIQGLAANNCAEILAGLQAR